MLRPYFAIIKDSFREAFASRVLWILLALVTLMLVILAPLGIRLNLTTDFAWGDIPQGPQLVGKIRRAAATGEPSPGGHVWSLLDETTREKLAELQRVEEGENRDFFQGMETLRTALIGLIHRRDFYDEAAWEGVSLSKETKNYLARPRSELSEDELARMNRLLIEHAFPAHFRSRSPNSISLTYFWLDLSGRLPFSKDQADTFVREWFLSTVMSTIVGVIGTIAAILVTSTIIPQMFDPGSITLLLSKPISRSGLFITKVLGGCAFILLLVSYLIVGLWLIAGLRFGIWNQGVLWCIPIFLLMFLIYYSVSAFVGLVWKNAIVSVVVTVIFWLGCFMVGSAMHGIDALVLLPDRITKLTEADGALVTVTEAGRMHVWSDEDKDWRQTYEPGGGRGGGVPTIDGPVYHQPTKQLLVGQGFRNPFGIIGQRITLRLGKENTGWSLVDGPALPSGTATFVVDNDGSLLAIATDDIFRLQGDPAPASSELSIFGMTLPFGGASFRPALADSSLNFAEPIAAAADPQEPRLVVSSGNEVRLFSREENRKWAVIASRTLPGKEKEGAAVAMAGPSVLVAREDGKIWLLSSADLKVQKEMTLEHFTQPRFVAASADGSRFAVLFQNRRLWLIEGRTGAARLAPVSGQGDISAVTFSGDKLLVADHVNRVIAYDGHSLAKTETYWPQMSRVEMVYYYGILPVYTVFPKPGELDNTVQYVLTGKRTTDLGVFRGDLSQRREDLHPWRPVASGLAFVAVMLIVACIYIERQEF